MALQIQTAPTGVVRDAHYVIPTGASEPVRTLLTEPQRTNLCIRSEEFDTWTNNNSGTTVTTNTILAPNGTVTADLISGDGTVGFQGKFRTLNSFAGDGEKCVSIFLRVGTGNTTVQLNVRDTTASVARQSVTVTWTGSVPSLATSSGGTLYPVQNFGNGWWRLMFSVAGVVAANVHTLAIITANAAAVAGSVYVWGAQAENAVVPSSYIPTEAAAVVRNADSLYWELASLVPQELTVYVRSVNVGASPAIADDRNVLFIGSGTVTAAPRFRIFHAFSSQEIAVQYTDGTTSAVNSFNPSPAPALSDVLEYRGVLNANWSATIAASINGAAEQTATTILSGPAAAFAAARLWLTGGLSASNTLCAYTHIGIFRGTRDRAYCRANTGVV
jgi:hypothetical protein